MQAWPKKSKTLCKIRLKNSSEQQKLPKTRSLLWNCLASILLIVCIFRLVNYSVHTLIRKSQRNFLISWDCIRCSRVVRASGCQCQSHNSPGFDPSVLRHSGIWGAADEAVLNNVHPKNPPLIKETLWTTEAKAGRSDPVGRFPHAASWMKVQYFLDRRPFSNGDWSTLHRCYCTKSVQN